MESKLIKRLVTLDIWANKIHFARGAQRHRWFGWGRRYGQIVYFGSYYTATQCVNSKNTFTLSLEPYGAAIDVDCRSR